MSCGAGKAGTPRLTRGGEERDCDIYLPSREARNKSVKRIQSAIQVAYVCDTVVNDGESSENVDCFTAEG